MKKGVKCGNGICIRKINMGHSFSKEAKSTASSGLQLLANGNHNASVHFETIYNTHIEQHSLMKDMTLLIQVLLFIVVGVLVAIVAKYAYKKINVMIKAKTDEKAEALAEKKLTERLESGLYKKIDTK